MATTEEIPVFVCYEKGKTTCICHRDHKGCNRNCEKDIVSRDKFRDWRKTMNRDRFGKDDLDKKVL